MECLTPKQILTNWLKVRDQIPQINKTRDVWLSTKISILLNGWQSLGDLSFIDWSKQIEPTLLGIKGVAPIVENENKLLSQLPILTLICEVFAHAARGERPIELDEMMDHQEVLAQGILQQTMFILNRYEPQYILSLMDQKKGDIHSSTDQPDALILKIIDIMDNYCEALLDAYKHNYLPLSALVLKTMDVQFEFAHFIEKDASSRQNRKAALIKNEPNRKTRAFAEDLYDEKEWRSMKDGAKQIQTQVREFGETVNWRWNDDFQAHDTIYDWIRAHKKNS